MKILALLSSSALLFSTTEAFGPQLRHTVGTVTKKRNSFVRLSAQRTPDDQIHSSRFMDTPDVRNCLVRSATASAANNNNNNKAAVVAAAAIATLSVHPLSALAAEVEEYEYGAVSAPVGIAWAAGVLVILTALLPIFLRGGEEAFEEMKERESESWGKNADALKTKKKK